MKKTIESFPGFSGIEIWSWKACGYDCRIMQHPSFKHFCGYVGVPKGHPAYGKGYDDIDVHVHGGLTYADYSKDAPHLKTENLYLLGFDYAHTGDLVPGLHRSEGLLRSHFPSFPTKPKGFRERHWKLLEVKREVEHLAFQLKGIELKSG